LEIAVATSLDDAPVASATAALPVPLRIGLLGLGTVGSAVARLTRETAATLRGRGVSPVVTAAFVRDAHRTRPARAYVAAVTADPSAFLSSTFDVVIEALGGVEPARTLVAELLGRGIPVVSANKTLIASHGDALADLARRHATALRYEASCVAGVPFIGAFERRPLATRGTGVTAILNGTSNAILSSLAGGETFAHALENAQRRGLAEPDPAADVTGADAAQKLAILVRLFGSRSVDWTDIPATPLSVLEPDDLAAARTFSARVKPIAHAAWSDAGVSAFVAPALVPDAHPLALVGGATNGVAFDGEDGRQYFIGPGAGPSVTAATLLDDAVEIATEPVVRVPAAVPITRAGVSHPRTRWFVRIDCAIDDAEIFDLMGTFGVWCERVVRIAVDTRRYVVTLPATRTAIDEAADALRSAARAAVLCLPALDGDARC
jgi:homoserine dehydrogenase